MVDEKETDYTKPFKPGAKHTELYGEFTVKLSAAEWIPENRHVCKLDSKKFPEGLSLISIIIKNVPHVYIII